MITVRLLGLMSLDSSEGLLLVPEGTVRQVFQEILQRCPQLTEAQLHQAIVFVNKQQITGRRRLSVMIKDGDELALLSPASGG